MPERYVPTLASRVYQVVHSLETNASAFNETENFSSESWITLALNQTEIYVPSDAYIVCKLYTVIIMDEAPPITVWELGPLKRISDSPNLYLRLPRLLLPPPDELRDLALSGELTPPIVALPAPRLIPL